MTYMTFKKKYDKYALNIFNAKDLQENGNLLELNYLFDRLCRQSPAWLLPGRLSDLAHAWTLSTAQVTLRYTGNI